MIEQRYLSEIEEYKKQVWKIKTEYTELAKDRRTDNHRRKEAGTYE